MECQCHHDSTFPFPEFVAWSGVVLLANHNLAFVTAVTDFILTFWWWIWPILAGFGGLSLLILATGHVILNKRETSAAVGWIGVMWLAPFIGPFLYLLLGVNRIRKKAGLIQPQTSPLDLSGSNHLCWMSELRQRLPENKTHLGDLAEMANNLLSRPLLTGNRIKPLICGDEAYPQMIAAIDQAGKSITLTTYIFARDASGKRFIEAISRAQKRGVQVRVLIDAVGARYSFPTVFPLLRKLGIPYARFMPSLFPWQMPYLNLRSHRKVMVVDGRLGFTGGMNIAAGNEQSTQPAHPINDIHFSVEGPIVASLQNVFLEDWAFVTGEKLSGEPWFSPATPAGEIIARGITDGPDDNYDRLRMLILGAISLARSSIRVCTPYFLPDNTLISALNAAVLRGVQVDILIPDKNNLTIVDWASQSHLQELVRYGCRIWRTAPPFDHSKMMVVDDFWSMIGSANWDPRSLNLNFEFNVECYQQDFAQELIRHFERKRSTARMITIREVLDRPLLFRLRDGLARLFTPYL